MDGQSSSPCKCSGQCIWIIQRWSETFTGTIWMFGRVDEDDGSIYANGGGDNQNEDVWKMIGLRVG